MEENQEILFAKTLEKVKRLAREQGNSIRKEQVEETFQVLSLSEEQLAMVFEYLEKYHITIGESTAEEEDILSEEEIDYLEEYKKELLELPVFSDGEKDAFTLSAMAGETDAQGRLIQVYLPKVVEIAKLYAGQGVFVEDLIGEGNVALSMGVTMLGCLEKKEEAEGMLMKMVMDAMEDFISDSMEETQKDNKVLKKVNQVAEKAKELSEELRRKVTVEELCAETGLSEKAVRDAMRLSGYTIEDIENPS